MLSINKSNVLNYENNIEDYQDLDIPICCDLVTSAVIYDATFSGYNSIILGTFGKTVLFYSPLPVNSEDRFSRHQKFHYEKKREIPFKHSVMGLCKTQLSGNGAYDLVILTLNGLSIWQYSPGRLAELVNQRFEENEQMFLESINSKLSESRIWILHFCIIKKNFINFIKKFANKIQLFLLTVMIQIFFYSNFDTILHFNFFMQLLYKF